MSPVTIQIPPALWAAAVKASLIALVCLAMGVILTLFSPTVALTMEPEARIWFWLSLCFIGGGGIFLCDLILDLSKQDLPALAKATLKSFCGTIAVLIPLFLTYELQYLPKISTTVIFVWAIMVLIVASIYALTPKLMNSTTVDSTVTERHPQILKRLPINLQTAELYALSAEDHYVRVHTSNGDVIILMRLSDAIAETGTLEGAQIHRSWWVSKTAIEVILPKGRAAEITLKKGTRAPVSRNGLKILKNLNWL